MSTPPCEEKKTISDIQKKTLAILEQLKNAPPGYADCPMNLLTFEHSTQTLTAAMDTVTSMLDSSDLNGEHLSENFLKLLAEVIDWKVFHASSMMLLRVYKIVSHLNRRWPDKARRLLRLVPGQRLEDLVKLENKCGGPDDEQMMVCLTSVTTVHLVSALLPALPYEDAYRDANGIFLQILNSGRAVDGSAPPVDEGEDIAYLLGLMFPCVGEVCQQDASLASVTALFLKMIYWAKKIEREATDYVDVRDIAGAIKSALSSLWDMKVLIGLSIIDFLGSECLPFLRQDEQLVRALMDASFIVSPLRLTGNHGWIDLVYDSMIHGWATLAERTVLESFMEHDVEDGNSSNVRFKVVMIRCILNFILPDRTDPHPNYARLRQFVCLVTNTDASSWHEKGPPTDQLDIRRFESLVLYVVDAVDELKLDIMADDVPGDMRHEEEYMRRPLSPGQCELGLSRLASIDRALAASISPADFNANDSMAALRLLSILHEVNEHWGALFSTLTTGRIIDRGNFVSHNLDLLAEMIEDDEMIEVEPPLLNLTWRYPFYISFEIRYLLFLCHVGFHKLQSEDEGEIVVQVTRGDLIGSVARQLDSPGYPPTATLTFKFDEELGEGTGPTKEFYTEFSRECLKHELDVWIGERVVDHTGTTGYVHSPCGLFPAPKSPTPSSEPVLKAVGRVIVQTVMDGHRLDVDFSPAFYKGLLGASSNRQSLTLFDLGHVLPGLFKFAKSLVDSLREKRVIDEDDTLTPEEKKEAASEITCDGSSFEDLYLNFTLPCFPEIEMKEGGRDVPLTIDNLEEYLKLVVWWLLHKGPQDSLALARSRLGDFATDCLLNFFFPDELGDVLGGTKNEQWTTAYLNDRIQRGPGFASERPPVVRHLFETLVSFSEEEQSRFLKFVTGSARLPYGGLVNLRPEMVVEAMPGKDDPDRWLPTAMTCSNTLFLPRYSCKETLRSRLLLAITDGCSSFDFL